MVLNYIEDEITKKGISRLCHFTKSQKAMHILSSEDGIKAVDFLDKSLYEANDTKRLDGKLEYVNCSLEYPNHWYWNRIKDNDPLFQDWVILLINPALMTLSTTEFCPVNAAKSCGAYIGKGDSAFNSLFATSVNNRARSQSMLPCCPTDDQAEVLVYKNISRMDILGVVVKDEEQANKEIIRWNQCGIPQFDVLISPDLYNGTWSRKVRQGIKPQEYRYERGE